MKLFDGNFHSEHLEKIIIDRVREVPEPKVLAIIQVGYNDVSNKYIKLKERLCYKLGIPVEIHTFDTKTPSLQRQIAHEVSREDVGGCIIQLPLPSPEYNHLLDLIPLSKDLDLLSTRAQENFYTSDFSRKMPVVRALEYFLSSCQLDFSDIQACIIGDGFLVGKPIQHFLQTMGATTNFVTNYKKGHALLGNFFVLGVGSPKLVAGEDLPKGSFVVDFGSSIHEGKLVGDLDMDSSLSHLEVISPSPGGMGPLVVRFLLMNHLGI